jgi:hypothetical protein
VGGQATLVLEQQQDAFDRQLARAQPARHLQYQVVGAGQQQVGVFKPVEQFEPGLEPFGRLDPLQEFGAVAIRGVEHVE